MESRTRARCERAERRARIRHPVDVREGGGNVAVGCPGEERRRAPDGRVQRPEGAHAAARTNPDYADRAPRLGPRSWGCAHPRVRRRVTDERPASVAFFGGPECCPPGAGRGVREGGGPGRGERRSRPRSGVGPPRCRGPRGRTQLPSRGAVPPVLRRAERYEREAAKPPRTGHTGPGRPASGGPNGGLVLDYAELPRRRAQRPAGPGPPAGLQARTTSPARAAGCQPAPEAA